MNQAFSMHFEFQNLTLSWTRSAKFVVESSCAPLESSKLNNRQILLAFMSQKSVSFLLARNLFNCTLNIKIAIQVCLRLLMGMLL